MPKLTQEEARKEWLKDLRSGEFVQGQGSLSHDNKYCCIGVACETMIRCEGEEALIRALPEHPEEEVTDYGAVAEDSVAPPELMSWLGLRTANGMYDDEGYEPNSLIAENDNHDKSFVQIAEIIESEPEGLFDV